MIPTKKEDEPIVKLIHHSYLHKPTSQELANIRNTRRRVLVKNPQVSDYDSMFDGYPISTNPPQGFSHRSDVGVVIKFFFFVAFVFFGISFLLGTLF